VIERFQNELKGMQFDDMVPVNAEKERAVLQNIQSEKS
jgi:hypothetical protein